MIVHYRHSKNPDIMFSGDNAYDSIENKVILERVEDNVSFHAPLIYVYGLVRLAHESKVVINSQSEKRILTETTTALGGEELSMYQRVTQNALANSPRAFSAKY